MSLPLVMMGQGIKDDVPPVTIQPPLLDGVHLRWAFRREIGFPWWGYFLFRRPTEREQLACLSSALRNREPGEIVPTTLPLAIGTLSSDKEIRFTDNFPSPGTVEVDLAGRTWLRFTMPSTDIASRIEAEFGFSDIGDAPRRHEAWALRFVATYGGFTVAEKIVSGNAGDIATVSLEADAIDEVAIVPLKEAELPQSALIELCYLSVGSNRRRGWKPVPNCRQPITLPLFHPDYPATANAPINVPAAESEALARVRYGSPAPFAGPAFAEMHTALVSLVKGGPAGAPMADPSRAEDLAGVAMTATGAAPPKLAAMHPLDLVLLAAIHPAAAQMLGLFWVDQTAVPGESYDYLIISDNSGAAHADPMQALSNWLSNNPGYDGFIVWNKRAVPAPPLPSPEDPRAYSLPIGAVVAPGGPGQTPLDAAGLVGLRWTLPLTAGVLLPGSAVSYHLWREGLGNGDHPAASVDLGDWLTKAGPVLIGQPIGSPFSVPQRPIDWPNFPLHRIDRVTKAGWYGYRVSGMDLFGRISPPSFHIPWQQWTPPPTPRPWYYKEPPSDAVVHPSAVRVLDKIPPPPPVGVEATVLDPRDPYVIADAAYLAWRTSLPVAVRGTLVGLRVRWRWTATQIRQAPDTKEFRVYFNPGGSLPLPDARAASNWSQRVHVALYTAASSISPDGSERLYEVFLPIAGGAVFAAGVPLTPTLAEPIVYAHVGVSAADGAVHSADDPQWAVGAWGGRAGNEGLLGVPSKIYRVRRDLPDPPAPPPDSERVYATPADYHAKSFYTFRWVPAAYLKTHVFRAMDDSLFAVDRTARPRPAINATSVGIFPDPAIEPRWDALKRGQVADELNGLNVFPQTPAGNTAAREAYRALSNDGLRVLAGLAGNDAAFSQLTIQPLDPADPLTANRVGPDNPPDFVVDPALRIYVDTIDGRSTNRYFYRAAYVDGASNRSKLSLSGPPIWLPNVVPPRPPVLNSVSGGERRITIVWASNREGDLTAYRIYRADRELDARDLRAMTLVHTEVVPAGDPDARPASVTWTDDSVAGLSNRWYVITAVDDAQNESAPSRVAVGRAFDESQPVPPVLTANWTAAAPPADARLTWTSTDETRVERRVLQSLQWDPVGDWRAPGAYDETIPLDATLSWRLRLRVRKYTGAIAIGTAIPLNHL